MCYQQIFPSKAQRNNNNLFPQTILKFHHSFCIRAPLPLKEKNMQSCCFFFASYETNHKNVKLWCIIIIIMIIHYYYYYSYIEIYQLSYET